MANYLIVGGSSGIGLSLANLLAAEGHQVYATYNTHYIQSEHDLIRYHPLNVLDENITLDFLPEILNGIVYCPGSINLRPFDRIKPDDFIADYHLNVAGAVKIIQAVLPRLKKSVS